MLGKNESHDNKEGWGINQTHKNPIGHTDVPVTIQIIANDNYFDISINKATDFIHYNYRIPPWAINYAMVGCIYKPCPVVSTPYSSANTNPSCIRKNYYEE
uniref:Galectin n=1 Tax=Meloidogyne enterolobii TaxID=390850 RepID=A0A6V7UHZ9_MELEN|nr:unnamed protein product [Meloidogyne enterolobii]